MACLNVITQRINDDIDNVLFGYREKVWHIDKAKQISKTLNERWDKDLTRVTPYTDASSAQLYINDAALKNAAARIFREQLKAEEAMWSSMELLNNSDNPGGYIVDLTNYHLETPVLFALKSQESSKITKDQQTINALHNLDLTPDVLKMLYKNSKRGLDFSTFAIKVKSTAELMQSVGMENNEIVETLQNCI